MKVKLPDASWEVWITEAYNQRINLSAQGFYATPNLFMDWTIGKGHPYNYFAYGASCSEVEIDTLTGDFSVLRTDILMDVGDSINPAIDIGQVSHRRTSSHRTITHRTKSHRTITHRTSSHRTITHRTRSPRTSRTSFYTRTSNFSPFVSFSVLFFSFASFCFQLLHLYFFLCFLFSITMVLYYIFCLYDKNLASVFRK